MNNLPNGCNLCVEWERTHKIVSQSVREGFLLCHPDACQPATEPDGAPFTSRAETLGK